MNYIKCKLGDIDLNWFGDVIKHAEPKSPAQILLSRLFDTSPALLEKALNSTIRINRSGNLNIDLPQSPETLAVMKEMGDMKFTPDTVGQTEHRLYNKPSRTADILGGSFNDILNSGSIGTLIDEAARRSHPGLEFNRPPIDYNDLTKQLFNTLNPFLHEQLAEVGIAR